MRRHDGKWICRQCGAVLDVPGVRDPNVIIKAASGQPNVRVLVVDGEEIHSCELGRE